jgi:hypothetical protein
MLECIVSSLEFYFSVIYSLLFDWEHGIMHESPDIMEKGGNMVAIILNWKFNDYIRQCVV